MIPHSHLAEIATNFVILPAVAPAAVVATGYRGPAGFEFAEGAAFKIPSQLQGPRVFFDLASITKSFVAITVARLVQQGRLSFDTPLRDLLPEARASETGSASVLLLLAHRAGLQAHRTLFAPLLAGLPFERAPAISEVLNGRRAECAGPAPASGHPPPVYSDLGFALVGLALERLEQLPLDELVDREVCAPLGLDVGSARMLRARHVDFAARCMPTETVPFRGGEVQGMVHDENAWVLSGHALSGHAGLFGTAHGVARFGAALLEARRGGSAWLDAKTFAPLLEERPGGTLRAGFDGKSADQSSAGTRAGARTFGHLGFTGTSFWCDPDANRVLVLLTNRVCPTRDNPKIRTARPAVNDALFAAFA